jgi:hypothetical protein
LRRVGVQDGSETAQWIERSVLGVAAHFVPVEVVTPPIRMDGLAELDPLWIALRDAGAQGSDASALYAFSLQFNPEVALLQPDAVGRQLQAYFLLEPWLVEATDVDLVRRVLPYVQPFPPEYMQSTIREPAPSSWDVLIGRYVAANPTRNRPLDLLPLFRYCTDHGLAEDTWLDVVAEPELVKSRPTFHYRLPNSRIGQHQWSPAEAWNLWVEIERLADDTAGLDRLRLEYLAAHPPTWIARVRRLMTPEVSTP